MRFTLVLFLISACVFARAEQVVIPIDFKIEYHGSWHKITNQRTYGFLKFVEPYPDINPSVYIQAWGGPFKDPESLLEPMVGQYRKRSKNFKYTAQITETTINNYPAYHVQFSCFEEYGGKWYGVLTDLWGIPRGNNAAYVIFNTDLDEPDLGRTEAMEITKSLKFLN